MKLFIMTDSEDNSIHAYVLPPGKLSPEQLARLKEAAADSNSFALFDDSEACNIFSLCVDEVLDNKLDALAHFTSEVSSIRENDIAAQVEQIRQACEIQHTLHDEEQFTCCASPEALERHVLEMQFASVADFEAKCNCTAASLVGKFFFVCHNTIYLLPEEKLPPDL